MQGNQTELKSEFLSDVKRENFRKLKFVCQTPVRKKPPKKHTQQRLEVEHREWHLRFHLRFRLLRDPVHLMPTTFYGWHFKVGRLAKGIRLELPLLRADIPSLTTHESTQEQFPEEKTRWKGILFGQEQLFNGRKERELQHN